MKARNALFEVEDEQGSMSKVPRKRKPQALRGHRLRPAARSRLHLCRAGHLSRQKLGPAGAVEVPFGKGGKATTGFCVRVTDVPPNSGYEIKSVTRVLDDEAIVDEHIMKLTRWMADYYLCGWGQVALRGRARGRARQRRYSRGVICGGTPQRQAAEPITAGHTAAEGRGWRS